MAKKPVPIQERLNFNPIEATPQERERISRHIRELLAEEEAEEFGRLPGESLGEFIAARDAHVSAYVAFGPAMPKEPCETWKIVHGSTSRPAGAQRAATTAPHREQMLLEI